MIRRTLIVALFTWSVVAALPAPNEQSTSGIRYVALGDSYTIGEGATPDEAWPNLLVKHLREKGIKIELIANPARTGWTTQDVIERELPDFVTAKPTFATLLIGVNDWVQEVSEKAFRQRLAMLMDQMLKVLPGRQRMLVVTIPDFGITPTGPHYARGRNISQGIAQFNDIIVEEAKSRELRVVDIFPLSKQMKSDRSLVAKDGLHPSSKEYAEWERVIFPAAFELLLK
jgi:acyl-CoA thioesterase I